jgi:hypothetical protein
MQDGAKPSSNKKLQREALSDSPSCFPFLPCNDSARIGTGKVIHRPALLNFFILNSKIRGRETRRNPPFLRSDRKGLGD